jgi:diacylglycerol kinase (ATP)
VRVILLFNDRSGTGAAPRRVQHLSEALTAEGHHTLTLSVGAPETQIHDALKAEGGAGAAIIVGGDGSVHHALPVLIRTAVPLWHAPLGTENLVARELRHSRRSGVIRAALAAPKVRTVDTGDCNGRAFLVMVSVGPDAGVIHRMSQRRTGPITKLSYTMPILREAFAPSLGPISIEVDGREVVGQLPGIAVVANSRQYATRIDPAAGAILDDGLLDIIFMPATSVAATLYRLAGARLRSHGQDVVRLRGKHVRILRGAVPAQVDGEALENASDVLEIAVRPGTLRVHSPAG